MCVQITKSLKPYLSLDHDQEELVATNVQEKSYGKGDYLLRAANVSTEIGLVISGILRYYYIDEDGNEITAMFIQEGDFFTDLESFKNSTPSSGYIQAMKKAEVLVWDRASHHELSAQIPGWGSALSQIAQKRLLNQLTFSRSLINNDALHSYKRFVTTYPSIAAEVPDLYLASFLGMSKYTLSRLKSKVKKDHPDCFIAT